MHCLYLMIFIFYVKNACVDRKYNTPPKEIEEENELELDEEGRRILEELNDNLIEAVVEASGSSDIIYAILLMIGIIYPASYDLLQFYRGGVAEYFSDIYNYADMLYIYGSLANSVLQMIYGPQELILKIMMILLVVLLITKTFFFLRMFEALTPIVVMITTVVYDLRIFLLFYFILILLFS